MSTAGDQNLGWGAGLGERRQWGAGEHPASEGTGRVRASMTEDL